MSVLGLFAAAVVGVASIIDGDTLDIHGQRVRLAGIDAPESSQLCIRDGEPWRCGSAAAAALDAYIDRRTVTCEPHGKDRYKRTLATCSVEGVELNAWLVEQGWALDYRRYSKGAYEDEQAVAQKDRRGIWSAEFDAPWDWRRKH